MFYTPEAVHGEAYAKGLWKGCEVHVLYGHHESRLRFGCGSQYPSGETTHQIFVKGPGTGDEYILMHTFTGATANLDLVNVPLERLLDGIRFIRIKTIDSPSWVAWREIEAIAGK